MKNPFKARENRVKTYYIGAISLCIVLIVVYNKLGYTGPWGFQKNSDELVQIIVCVALSLTVIMSAVLISYRLCFKGTSKEFKLIILKRHMTYFLFYLVYFLRLNFVSILDYIENTGYRTTIKDAEIYFISEAIGDTVGIILAIIRLSEPYVWEAFKLKIQQIFFCCCKYDVNKKAKYSRESLDSFLKSAMNIEYVC